MANKETFDSFTNNMGFIPATSAINPEFQKSEAQKKTSFSNLKSLLGSDPSKLTSKSIEETYSLFKTTLLGGKEESELDEASKTLLSQGTEIAGKISARLKTFEKSQSTPGVQAQTSLIGGSSNSNSSLLGQ